MICGHCILAGGNNVTKRKRCNEKMCGVCSYASNLQVARSVAISILYILLGEQRGSSGCFERLYVLVESRLCRACAVLQVDYVVLVLYISGGLCPHGF